MSYEVKKEIDKIDWEDHFMDKDSRIKWIYTREKDGAPITVMVIELAKGISLPDHKHRDQPDLIYPIKGKATMYIEGEGEFPLRPGMVVLVPPNTAHAVRNVEETVLMYNVFAPAIPYRKGMKK